MVRNRASQRARCFCQRESEPVISRIGCVLHARVRVCTRAGPTGDTRQVRGKEERSCKDGGRGLFTSVFLAASRCPVLPRGAPVATEFVGRSKRREKRLVTEARKSNEKSLTVR